MSREAAVLWDGSKRPFHVRCECGAETLFMEGVEEKGRPQVFVFCEKCGYRQTMIDDRPLSKKDIEFAMKRARELGLTK